VLPVYPVSLIFLLSNPIFLFIVNPHVSDGERLLGPTSIAVPVFLAVSTSPAVTVSTFLAVPTSIALPTVFSVHGGDDI
jgi:hypothetical protein